MMINKIFIDCLEELKGIHNSKKWFKNIHYRIAIDKAFNTIDRYLMSIEKIYPAHIGDFVVFLDLATTVGLFENDSYLNKSGVKIKFELDMNNISDEYTALEVVIPFKEESSDLKYQFITIFDIEPWDIVFSCSNIKSGVGITGDHIGEFENVSILVNKKRVSNIFVEEDTDTNNRNEYIERSTGYLLIRTISMAVCVVFMNLSERLSKKDYNIFNAEVIKNETH